MVHLVEPVLLVLEFWPESHSRLREQRNQRSTTRGENEGQADGLDLLPPQGFANQTCKIGVEVRIHLRGSEKAGEQSPECSTYAVNTERYRAHRYNRATT
jgi:hypothetical protein